MDKCYSEPPKKRRKLNNKPIKSILFQNTADHAQFQRIYGAIESCPLIRSLNIARDISQEIAEYAIGIFLQCFNKECPNDISILSQDSKYYSHQFQSSAHSTQYIFSHTAARQVGYKFCSSAIRKCYYCSECMHNVSTCTCPNNYDCIPCLNLHFEPHCDKCSLCQTVVYDCKCEICDVGWACDMCAFIACHNCYINNGSDEVIDECCECNKVVCSKCRSQKGCDYCVCNDCFNGSVIKCNKCKAICQLCFKSNEHLFGLDGNNEELVMVKCYTEDCEVFVCFNCDENDRNGKEVICSQNGCNIKVGLYCDTHICNTPMSCNIHH